MAYEKKKYVQSDTVTSAQQAVQKQQAQKPGAYQSLHQQGIHDVLGQIQNREKFNYNINEDALYQQAARNYINQGRMAMMDTMGQAAALTGGYGNSYAQQAGQQAYQGYLQGLNELTPQYYQMALDKYQMEGDELLNRYALLQEQENADYGRYQDQLSQYYTELDRLQGLADNERAFDYGAFADEQAYNQWATEFEEDMRRYDQEWAEAHPEETGGGGSGGGGNPNPNPGPKKKNEDEEEEEEEEEEPAYDPNINRAIYALEDIQEMIGTGYAQLTRDNKGNITVKSPYLSTGATPHWRFGRTV